VDAKICFILYFFIQIKKVLSITPFHYSNVLAPSKAIKMIVSNFLRINLIKFLPTNKSISKSVDNDNYYSGPRKKSIVSEAVLILITGRYIKVLVGGYCAEQRTLSFGD